MNYFNFNSMILHVVGDINYRPFHTTMLLDAHQCASSSTAETMHIDRDIVQLYKHSVAIEKYTLMHISS